MELVARLLVGTRTGPGGAPACTIVDTGHRRALDVAIELPDGELEAMASAAQMGNVLRSEEHTSELQSLMRTSYAVFCLKKKNTHTTLLTVYNYHTYHTDLY